MLLLSRNFELLSRNFDLLCENFEIVSRNFDIVIRNFEIPINRNKSICSPNALSHYINWKFDLFYALTSETMQIRTKSAGTRLKYFVMYETLIGMNYLFRNAQCLFNVGFPRSPHLDAYAGLGLCCLHASYIVTNMFEGLDVAGWGFGSGGGDRGGRGDSNAANFNLIMSAYGQSLQH